MTIGYKVCAEQTYPLSGVTIFEWNYYIVNDESLLPSAWIAMSDEDRATYLNEDANCHWVKGWAECDDDDGFDKVLDDEAGEQEYKVVLLERW
jgi:hypothetical protein